MYLTKSSTGGNNLIFFSFSHACFAMDKADKPMAWACGNSASFWCIVCAVMHLPRYIEINLSSNDALTWRVNLPLFRRLPLPSKLQFHRSFLNWYRHSKRLRRTDSRSVSAKPGSLRQSLFWRRVRVICSHCFKCALPVGGSLENGPGSNTKGSRPVSLGVKGKQQWWVSRRQKRCDTFTV